MCETVNKGVSEIWMIDDWAYHIMIPFFVWLLLSNCEAFKKKKKGGVFDDNVI